MGFADKKRGVEGRFERVFSGRNRSRSLIRRIILIQALATVLVSTSLLLLGWVAAYSALLGGSICVIPNGYLAVRIMRTSGLSPAQRTGRLIQGEAGKLIQTAVLFAVVFALVRPLDPVALMGTFVAVQLLHWVVPLINKIG